MTAPGGEDGAKKASPSTSAADLLGQDGAGSSSPLRSESPQSPSRKRAKSAASDAKRVKKAAALRKRQESASLVFAKTEGSGGLAERDVSEPRSRSPMVAVRNSRAQSEEAHHRWGSVRTSVVPEKEAGGALPSLASIVLAAMSAKNKEEAEKQLPVNVPDPDLLVQVSSDSYVTAALERARQGPRC